MLIPKEYFTTGEVSKIILSIVEQSQDGISLIDEQGNIVLWNKAQENITGIKQCDAIGRSIWDIQFSLAPDEIKTPELLAQLKTGIKKVLELKADWAGQKMEQKIKCPDGTCKVVQDSSFIIQTGSTVMICAMLREISHQKQAEEERKQSEEMFRNYVENAPDGVFVVDNNGRYLEVNKSACRITGYSKEEIINMSIRDLLAKESLEDGLAHFNKLIETGAATSDLWHKHKDGSKRCLTINAIKLSGTMILGFAKDITELKAVENILLESEEKYRLLVENLNEGIWHIDKDAITVFVNQYMTDMLGYTREEMTGKHLFTFMDEQGKKLAAMNIDRRQKGIKEQHDFEFIRKDGTRIYTSLETSPIVDKNGNYMGAIAGVHDITGNKRIEKALWESEYHLKEAQEIALLGNWAFDLATQKVRWSDQIYKLYERDPALGPPTPEEEAEYYTPEQAAILRNYVQRVIETGEKIDYEFTAIFPIGKTRVFAGSMLPVKNDEGNIIQIFGILQDITTRKQAEKENKLLEEQLRQSQKLEAVGQLAGGIAHDFNNLLGGIIGNADLVRSKLDKRSTLVKHLDLVLDAGQRAATLVGELLAFARKRPREIETLDANKKIKQLCEILKHTIDKRIKIIKKLNADSPFIQGDRHHLQSALLNICLNARDAMPQGGTLILESQNVYIDEAYCKNQAFAISAGNYVQISITDTGTGMDKETQSHLFEPFFTTKEVGKGTGLGLASVYGCVKQHNGFIKVYSEKDHGTTFKMFLPKSEITKTKHSESESALIKGSGNILVVEDEEIMCNVLKEYLEDLGYKAECCSNGMEALKTYKKDPSKFDLVILDMIMPEMSGKDCFFEMIKINPQIKIIICSGFIMNEEIELLLNNGAKAYMGKPFRQSDVSMHVAKVLKEG